MKDFLNKLYRNHSLIYKVLLFICTTFLIVYLFPKSGKFKYNFEKGKPWQSENLYAPFDFAIKKSESEINKEKEDIINNGTLYFTIDSSIENKVKTAFKKEFTTNFSDTISLTSSSELYKTGIDIISQLYAFGVLNESYSFSEEKRIVILDERVKKQEGIYFDLIKLDKVTSVIEKVLKKHKLSSNKTEFVSLFYDLVEPNLTFDKSFTDKALQEELDKIVYARGSIEKQTLIVSKGEVVQGDKYQILKSLQSEYESQVWSKSSYIWILFAYTLLVALALLMLLLFLMKYKTFVYETK